MINHHNYFLIFFIYTFNITLQFSTTEASPSKEECWWTGCQSNSWAIKGCESYNRTENEKTECEDGFQYKCCVDIFTEESTHTKELGNIQTKKMESEDESFKLEHTQRNIQQKNVYRNPYKTTSVTKRRKKVVDTVKVVAKADKNSPSSTVEVSVQNCGKRIVRYYTSWGLKKITSNVLAKLTHVIYAFMEMHSDGTVDLGSPDIAQSDDVEEETKNSRNRLEHLMNLAKFFPHIKIMFAVGGGENSQYFSQISASSQSRVKFIASIIKLIKKYGFDGVDIDWEFPGTGIAVESSSQDKSNYVLLMKDLRQGLNVFAKDAGRKNKYLISFAGAAGRWTLDPGFDLPGLLQYADFVNVMTYDYFGAWSSEWGAYTGPPAPLYFGMPSTFVDDTNVNWTIKYYICKSKLSHKINMGIPFYGRFWNNVGDSVDGKDQMWRTANPVNGTFQGGSTPWFKIQEDHLSDLRFIQSFHEKSKSPYAWNAETKVFLGYENKKSIEFKTMYASNENVGGLMIWSVDLDDDDFTLLNSVYNAPLCNKTNLDKVNYKCLPTDKKRWWTLEDGDKRARTCGPKSDKIDGIYEAECEPNTKFNCCSSYGYCGSGPDYCDCKGCKRF